MATKFASVDDYVAAQPPDVQRILGEIRNRAERNAPGIEEAISYGIPAFELGGRALIYVGAWKKHIAVYPVPDADETLQRDIERYRSGKGTLKFELDEPFPFELFDRLVQAAVAGRAA
jgi:uncharacterized protein YdhG (YjbR/CyaY superfamily)